MTSLVKEYARYSRVEDQSHDETIEAEYLRGKGGVSTATRKTLTHLCKDKSEEHADEAA